MSSVCFRNNVLCLLGCLMSKFETRCFLGLCTLYFSSLLLLATALCWLHLRQWTLDRLSWLKCYFRISLLSRVPVVAFGSLSFLRVMYNRITRLECDNFLDTSRNVKFVIYRDEVEIDNKFYIEKSCQYRVCLFIRSKKHNNIKSYCLFCLLVINKK